jgi:hypothetical protein|tara:strand:+ start:3274 stop:3396 length:123 start_codon:yes stop_codon:yes gene_type:complete
MVYIKKFWKWITTPYTKYKERKELQKRLDEMKKRDPFIYK